jgi:glycosyltransferase involved in cell wall biosynthesis
MPRITALLETRDDALRLGRCLETLYPCDEILVVDRGSRDRTVHIAREYGARVLEAAKGLALDHFLQSARAEWILHLDPHESLTEALAASLYEWKSEALAPDPPTSAFCVYLREETTEGWVEHPAALTRLVPADWSRWEGRFPAHDASAVALEGELLRFVLP